MTFITRPSVPRPTGTEIGPPWSMAFMPRTMPSVAAIAMQRTRPSPRCCCTSRMTLIGCGYVEAVAHDFDSFIDRRQLALSELHVYRGACDLDYMSYILSHRSALVET